MDCPLFTITVMFLLVDDEWWLMDIRTLRQSPIGVLEAPSSSARNLLFFMGFRQPNLSFKPLKVGISKGSIKKPRVNTDLFDIGRIIPNINTYIYIPLKSDSSPIRVPKNTICISEIEHAERDHGSTVDSAVKQSPINHPTNHLGSSSQPQY